MMDYLLNRIARVPAPTFLLVLVLLVSGCQSKPKPDAEMLTSPTGLWTGVTNPDISVDIQDGGFFKLTQGGQEIIGEWKPAGPDQMTITLNGQTQTVPFKRKDLLLTLTLPGQSSPLEFSQM